MSQHRDASGGRVAAAAAAESLRAALKARAALIIGDPLDHVNRAMP
jgi:hypothetical protein